MNPYSGKIKVICEDLQCFPVDPKTLDAISCGSYDPYAITDPDVSPVETISAGEWNRRRNERAAKWHR